RDGLAGRVLRDRAPGDDHQLGGKHPARGLQCRLGPGPAHFLPRLAVAAVVITKRSNPSGRARYYVVPEKMGFVIMEATGLLTTASPPDSAGRLRRGLGRSQ